MTETGQRVLASLRPQERKVLIALCEGKSNREIATEMGVSEQTVKNYVRRVLTKAGHSRRLDMAIFAFHHGIVNCPCPHSSK